MIPFDRWLEMDLTWFDPTHDLHPQITALVERVAPLLQSVNGDRGIFFNVGWLIDLITEWTGSPQQHIPTRSRRTLSWSQRTYADLAQFTRDVRAVAAEHGLPDLKIGVLFVGWGHVVWPPDLKIYDFDSDWYDRHPEVYGGPLNFIGMPVLFPINRLHHDSYPYATQPSGLSEGAYFPDFFGAQWGHLSRFLELDALHLRDGLTGPMVYTRNGPYGTSSPHDPTQIKAFSQSVRDLYKAVKTANPDSLIFGYSSAISPTADWRVGCVDFEALIADGYIDGWIEQTWGGAWQDWWHQLWKGWTFQLANLLTRGVLIAKANQQRSKPCKFYNLIETWDGWEPWDTLHQVPHKLRWAIWAFSHAATLTPSGPKVPDGSYISWMNNGAMELLSESDIEYVRTHLDAAQMSASQVEQIYGASIVYNRPMMEWLSQNQPEKNRSEWIDDQTALLMKWGLPALSATRTEWLSHLSEPSNTLLLQTPGQLSDETKTVLLTRNQPMLAVGSAGTIDEHLRDQIGITLHGAEIEAGFYVCAGDSSDSPTYDRPYIARHQPIDVANDTRVHYQSSQTPLIVSRANWIYWQPPDWSEPNNQFVPKYQLGSTYPHFRVASLLHEAAHQADLSYLEGVERSQTIAFHLWRSGSAIYLLFGNLETGEFGDSRTSRMVQLHLSRTQLGLGTGVYMLRRIDLPDEALVKPASSDTVWLEYMITLPPEQCAVYQAVSHPS